MQTLELLLNISLVLAALLKDLNIVLSILVFQARCSLLRLLNSSGISSLEFCDNGVENFDGATSGIKATTGSTMRTSISVDERNKVCLRTGALVGERLGGALLEVLDRRI